MNHVTPSPSPTRRHCSGTDVRCLRLLVALILVVGSATFGVGMLGPGIAAADEGHPPAATQTTLSDDHDAHHPTSTAVPALPEPEEAPVQAAPSRSLHDDTEAAPYGHDEARREPRTPQSGLQEPAPQAQPTSEDENTLEGVAPAPDPTPTAPPLPEPATTTGHDDAEGQPHGHDDSEALPHDDEAAPHAEDQDAHAEDQDAHAADDATHPEDQDAHAEDEAAHADEGEEAHGHGEEASTLSSQTRALVLGGFAGANGLVIIAAAVLRRRNPPRLPKHLQR